MAGSYRAYHLLYLAARALPTSSAFRCAERLADAQHMWTGPQRQAVAENLTVLLHRDVGPDDPAVRRVFRHFARYLLECFTMDRAPMPRVRIEGFKHLARARRGARGVLVLTAHLGNWELGGALLSRMSLPMTAVALPHADARLNRLFDRQRRRCGMAVIPVGASTVARSLEALRAGRCLAMLGDRPFGMNEITVPFAGRSVSLPRGPAVLSLRSGAPIVPAFLIREGDWAFRLCLEPAIYPSREGRPAKAVARIMQRYAAVLEANAERWPEQWMIFEALFGGRVTAVNALITEQANILARTR